MYTPLHLAAREGHTTCVEHLLSNPGIDVNIKGRVSLLSVQMLDLHDPLLHIFCHTHEARNLTDNLSYMECSMRRWV